MRRTGLLLAAALLSAAILAAAGAPRSEGRAPAPKPPRLSLRAPATATAGERVLATGTVARAPHGARVLLQRRAGRGWARLGGATVSGGGYRVSFTAPAADTVLSLRALLLEGSRRLAGSPTARVRVRARVPVAGAAPRALPAALAGPPASARLALAAPAVSLSVGSVAVVTLPDPLVSVTAFSGETSGATPGVSVSIGDGALTVVASAAATTTSTTLTVPGSGCTASQCGREFSLRIPVTVTPIAAPAGTVETLTEPSPDRVAAAVDHELGDELVITVGSPDAPGTRAQAEAAAAAAAGGVIAGGLEESGIYQVRWASPQDLAAKTIVLEAQLAVTSVGPSSVGLYSATSAFPVAPTYDLPKWTWPYQQVDAAGAWGLTTGSDVTVGIIDEGNVYAPHEDLNVAETIGISVPAFHATHVAGLACAKANAVGVVGMGQGCPIVSARWTGSFTMGVLGAMHAMARRPSVEVVNVSLGINAPGCADQHEQAEVEEMVAPEKRAFTQFLAGPEGRRIVWTFSAGNNCAPGAASPWAANSQLPNVITVAATNSDSSLASFSNYGPGIDVAAPGGVSTAPVTNGLISTATEFGCPSFDSCGGTCPPLAYCGAYHEDRGTSMAAPVVAGIAALVRSKNPALSGNEAGQCISSSAGTGGSGSTVAQSTLPPGFSSNFIFWEPNPIVNAPAAVECIPRTTASSYSGSGDGDGWAVALSQTAVYNVFHHSGVLQVACHFQADASRCWDPVTVGDAEGNDFATSGHPGIWLDQGSGRLYVYATRPADQRAGVVCIDTLEAAAEADAFCGFTPLTGAEEAPLYSGISALSDPALIGTRWYAVNYVNGAGIEGAKNKLLCFDLNTHAACSGQPFAVGLAAGVDEDSSYPPPAVAAIGTRVIVPMRIDGADRLACFEGNTATPCSGAWPVEPAEGFDSLYGAPFPLLNASGALTGLCLPTGADPCYSLAGAPLATPAGMTGAILPSSGWNGPALLRGSRVYVPNGNYDQVQCYDYGSSEPCANFPRDFEELALLYTVNADPERPRCLWVNSDGGAGQIQNFDAETGGDCE